MEVTMLVISIVSMVATIVSTIFTIRAKNEAKIILSEIKSTEIKLNNQDLSVKNRGSIDISNSGINTGVMGGIVTGGIHQGDK